MADRYPLRESETSPRGNPMIEFRSLAAFVRTRLVPGPEETHVTEGHVLAAWRLYAAERGLRFTPTPGELAAAVFGAYPAAEFQVWDRRPCWCGLRGRSWIIPPAPKG